MLTEDLLRRLRADDPDVTNEIKNLYAIFIAENLPYDSQSTAFFKLVDAVQSLKTNAVTAEDAHKYICSHLWYGHKDAKNEDRTRVPIPRSTNHDRRVKGLEEHVELRRVRSKRDAFLEQHADGSRCYHDPDEPVEIPEGMDLEWVESQVLERRLEGMSYQDMADDLGVKMGVVRGAMARLRKRARKRELRPVLREGDR